MKKLMKLGLFFALLLSLTNGISAAENVEEIWYQNYESEEPIYYNAISPTEDGGFITGRINGRAAALTKFDANGKVEWSKEYPEEPDRTELWGIRQTSDGGYIGVGYFFNATTSGDGWIFKLDRDGNLLWQDNTNIDYFDMYQRVEELSDGSFITVGPQGSGLITAHYSKDGKLIQRNTINIENWRTMDLGAAQMIVTTEGKIILSGIIDPEAPNKAPRSTYAMEINENGEQIWEKIYLSEGMTNLGDLVTSPDGGFAVINIDFTMTDGQMARNRHVIKYDSQGNEVWDKTFAGTDQSSGSLLSKNDGYYVILSERTATGGEEQEIVKLDLNGNEVGRYAIVNKDNKYISGKTILLSDGNFVTASSTTNVFEGMKYSIPGDTGTVIPVDPQPPIEVVTPKPSVTPPTATEVKDAGPKAGDASSVSIYGMLLLVSMASFVFIYKKNK